MATTTVRPATGPSVWHGRDLTADRSWVFELDDGDVAELEAALAAVRRDRLTLPEITAERFPLPTLSALLDRLGAQVRSGRGVALLRGVPVERNELADLELIYWGMCTHLGTGITQNGDAGLIHYVTDGVLKPNQGSRGVGKPYRAPLHVDLTDCASLLCIRQAADDPPSWLASSSHVHNEILRRRPDALDCLYEGFEWDRLGEHGDGEAPSTGYRVPVFSRAGDAVSCRYNRYWMAAAAKRAGDGFSAADADVLDLFDEIAHESRHDLEFEPGDVQFVNNYKVLHGRDEHTLEPDEQRKRLLMRIWLDFDEAGPFSDEAVVRYGIVRHGRLGWTAAQLAAGLPAEGHARRPDGAPML